MQSLYVFGKVILTILIKNTVNVVIFAGGKFRENVVKDISRGGNFHDSTPICFIKAYGFYFRVGVIFAKKTKARKTRKLPPTRKIPRLQYVFLDTMQS